MVLSGSDDPSSHCREQNIGESFPLAKNDFALQSNLMQTNWAEENLQTIRTLMERSAIYRRALAPIVLFAGAIGVLASISGYSFHLDSPLAFSLFWFTAAAIAISGAFVIVRRQAIKAAEPFWSPPTRRIAQTMLPPLTAGFVVGAVFTYGGLPEVLPFLWALFYGCALHAAGFCVPRGVKWLGWIYIILAAIGFALLAGSRLNSNPHILMGFFFGVLHLVYGAYLYLTEKGKNAA